MADDTAIFTFLLQLVEKGGLPAVLVGAIGWAWWSRRQDGAKPKDPTIVAIEQVGARIDRLVEKVDRLREHHHETHEKLSSIEGYLRGQNGGRK